MMEPAEQKLRRSNLDISFDASSINLEEQDQGRNTPLHAAAWHADNEKVKTLLERGAKINIQNFEGATPLMYAVQNGDLAMVKDMLEKMSSTDFKKTLTFKLPNGSTVLHLAMWNLHKNENSDNSDSSDSLGKIELLFARTGDKIIPTITNNNGQNPMAYYEELLEEAQTGGTRYSMGQYLMNKQRYLRLRTNSLN